MNYIGSKYSLLDFLHDVIKNVSGYQDGEDYMFAKTVKKMTGVDIFGSEE